jgi:murein DD-endopeptidase MepM/ murein hydrolase activator NlpD
MRFGVWFLVLGVFLAGLGAASAYATGTTTTSTTTTTTTTSTTTGTTTTSPTTTGTTTTTPTPGYSRLGASYLSKACVGAGAAAIAEPGRAVLALGTPASTLGPSAYPLTDPIVRFQSSAASGSGCRTARVSLSSVSLFGGALTARAVAATHGRGGVSGVEIFGSPVALRAGRPVHIGSWGEVTLQKTVGRLTAPLVVQLLAAHRSLPAGTTIAFAFSASRQAAHKSTTTEGKGSSAKTKHRHKPAEPLTAVPSLSYKPSHYVFPVDGGASYVDTYGANRSDVYDGWHHGDDLFAPLGTPVVAVARGTLSLVGWNEIGGWRLWLTDNKGNSFYYAHLAGYARWILKHRKVHAGQVVGFLGRTGDAFTTTPHLHFEIHPHEPAFVKLGYDGAVDPTTYLQKWRVEHVPADKIPQPARLRAPIGTPREEASVVWQQLLAARHLSASGAPIGATSSAQEQFEHPLMSIEASGIAPLEIAHIQPTGALVSSSQSNLPLLVGGPLGGFLVLAAAAGGAFFFRQRRRTADETST